jgi:hypothetical protein
MKKRPSQDVIWPGGGGDEMKGGSRGCVQLMGRTCDVFIPDTGSGGKGAEGAVVGWACLYLQ